VIKANRQLAVVHAGQHAGRDGRRRRGAAPGKNITTTRRTYLRQLAKKSTHVRFFSSFLVSSAYLGVGCFSARGKGQGEFENTPTKTEYVSKKFAGGMLLWHPPPPGKALFFLSFFLSSIFFDCVG
jgi:hypothetical protein